DFTSLEWLKHVAKRLGRTCPLQSGIVRRLQEIDDRKKQLFLELSSDVNAAAHVDVDQYELGGRALSEPDSLFTRRSHSGQWIAEVFEGRNQAEGNHVFVLDDENGRLCFAMHSRPFEQGLLLRRVPGCRQSRNRLRPGFHKARLFATP